MSTADAVRLRRELGALLPVAVSTAMGSAEASAVAARLENLVLRCVAPPLGEGTLPGVRCPVCLRVSWHPEDERQGWCSACQRYTSVGRRGA